MLVKLYLPGGDSTAILLVVGLPVRGDESLSFWNQFPFTGFLQW